MYHLKIVIPTVRAHPHMNYFSSKKNEGIKLQTVSFKRNVVNNYNKIAYKPKIPLKFVDGKCLVYQKRETIMNKVMKSLWYTGPMAGLGYLIYTNPFAEIFPASLPIFAILEMVLLKLWLNQIRRNQNLIREIYLLENGQATEVHYNNQMKRKLYGQPLTRIYYHSIFIDPDLQKQSQDSLIIDHQITRFPSSDEIQEGSQINMQGYNWIKYFSNGQNLLILPKNAQYINLEVLSRIFQGKIIINQKQSS